jgi:hypothetical protein
MGLVGSHDPFADDEWHQAGESVDGVADAVSR